MSPWASEMIPFPEYNASSAVAVHACCLLLLPERFARGVLLDTRKHQTTSFANISPTKRRGSTSLPEYDLEHISTTPHCNSHKFLSHLQLLQMHKAISPTTPAAGQGSRTQQIYSRKRKTSRIHPSCRQIS